MMKRSFHHFKSVVVLAACYLMQPALVSHAQITLTQASYAGWTLGLDSVRPISAFTVAPSNNASWDLSAATYGTALDAFTRVAVSGNATYPSATYSFGNTYSFNTLLSYQSIEMNGLSAAGIQGYGQMIVRQPISLFTLTGGANDSLVFNQQNIVYNNPKKIIAFPATSGSVWTSNYMWDLSFKLSVAAYSLANTPGIKRAYTTYVDSVKGWGKMRVKNVAGQTTAYMDVLAVKVSSQQKDSFFLNGVPAPATIVTAFGLSQGQLSNNYYISYFRAGEVQPLLTVNYTDNTYSTPSNSFVHAARLIMPTSVPNIPTSNRISAFPNPVSNGTLQIEIADANGKNYSYELINTAGQRLGGAALPVNKGRASISLEQQSGIYFLNVREDNVSIGVKQISVY